MLTERPANLFALDAGFLHVFHEFSAPFLALGNERAVLLVSLRTDHFLVHQNKVYRPHKRQYIHTCTHI